MLLVLSQLMAILCYGILVIDSGGVLFGWRQHLRRQQWLLLVAVLCHWLVIGLALVGGDVQAMGYDFVSILVMVMGLIMLAMLLLSEWQLLPFVNPLAALLAAIVLSLTLWPQLRFDHYYLATRELAHVFLSVLTAVVLLLTAWQTLMVFIQELSLRYKWKLPLVRRFPPLQATERQLFGFIAACFVCLAGVLISSLWLFIPFVEMGLVYKTIVTFVAWGIFAGLLTGRYYFGWRGQLAIRWTLGGVGLVLLLFFLSYGGGI
jgi:ABC-type uncharacterized transport system permease subunit